MDLDHLKEHIDKARAIGHVDDLGLETVETLVEAAQIYLNQQLAIIATVRRTERAEAIVKLLFPKYSYRAVRDGRQTQPPTHPERAWWWNGAFIEEKHLELGSAGDDVRCSVSSCVGGGEYDSMDLVIPAAWMDAPEDQLKGLVHTWIAEEIQRRAEAARAEQIRKAEAQAKQAADYLARLKGVE